MHTVLRQVLPPGQEDAPWDLTACILTLARFCGQNSELEVAERWFAQSALDDLLGVASTQVNDARLYRGLDAILPHKDELCQHLQRRYESLFGVRFEFLLYDVTSTYFEGQAKGNEKAARGYSRDQRSDCKQINIGLVVTPEGLPVGYEVFADAFRISKSDLYLRPVFHQKTERVDAHILVCFLSLVLWRTLENWMRCRGLGTCARQLIEEVATVRRVDMVLPMRAQAQESSTEVRLRVVTRPEPRAA